MFSHYVIEADEREAGLVIRERGGFRFYAAGPDFSGIEGRLFNSALEATRAAEMLTGRKSRRASTPARTAPLAPYGAQEGRVAASLLL
jgi:hypothetical protein